MNGKCWHCGSRDHDTGECPSRYDNCPRCGEYHRRVMAFSSEKHGETLTPEQQFEVAASTMDRQQLYNWAKRLWIETAQQAAEKSKMERIIDEMKLITAYNNNLRRELAEVREAIEEIQPGWAKNKLK